MPEFFPSYDPIISSQKNHVSPAVPVPFGDGYEQRFSFGLPAIPEEWDLVFIGTNSEINEIDDFLSAKALNSEYFRWKTPEGDFQNTWICKSWKKEKFDYNVNRLSAKFEQRGFTNTAF